MRPRVLALLVVAVLACSNDDQGYEAGVGSDREGCGDPGSNSVTVGSYSCACEPGFDWCGSELDDFTCCAVSESGDTEEPNEAPDLPCGPDHFEQVACVSTADSGSPMDTSTWACNGERWVEAPGLADFMCIAEGFSFAYGCEQTSEGASYICGNGPGTPCDEAEFGAACWNPDIIDTCIWGRRTVDRCSRLCSELELFGPGFNGGGCVEIDESSPAQCECN